MPKQLWKISKTDRIQVWPAESKIKYLSKPTKHMPPRFVNRGGIEAPKTPRAEIFAEFGLEGAAFATHRSGYYIMRKETETDEAIFVLDGKYGAKTENCDFKIGRGGFFILPAGTVCRDAVSGRGARVLWFRFARKSPWHALVGARERAGKSAEFEKIAALARIYADEAYSERASREHLRNILKVLAETLRREISESETERDTQAADAISEKIRKGPAKPHTRTKAAKREKLDTKTLDGIFVRARGTTFAQAARTIRLESALEEYARGATLKACAKKFGYADAYSLSNAIKTRFGSSPKRLLERGANAPSPAREVKNRKRRKNAQPEPNRGRARKTVFQKRRAKCNSVDRRK